MTYGKIFESLFTGSMVGTGPVLFSVWTYCIANSKPPGYVELNPVIVAAILGCDVTDIEGAIETLCQPDPRSRTPDEEGRKLIEKGNFLYWMPTWDKYNNIRQEEERRRQNREAQARFRSKRRNADSKRASALSAHGDGDGDGVTRDGDVQPPPPTGMGVQGGAPALKDKDLEDLRREWLAIRKEKHRMKTLTIKQWDRCLVQAEKAGITVKEMLEHLVLKGWQSFTAAYYAGSKPKMSPLDMVDDPDLLAKHRDAPAVQ